MFERVGQPHVLWALQEIARALGAPSEYIPSALLPAAPPEGAEAWSEGYWHALEPWRARRARLSAL